MSLASLGPQLLARVRSLLLPLLAGVRTVSSAYQSQGTNRPQTSASSAAVQQRRLKSPRVSCFRR